MLKLVDIVKEYGKDENIVTALRNVNLEFRQNEFVSILGQSGCGKTTMLNIIGGLDRYTSGDLIIDGVATKKYSDVDWDLYRNKRVGFIFQTYNLISHISIIANVEMALTLSGVGKKERTERAIKALADVGLSDQANKKPNQLSGGQMQRVSIARALINNPHIILADEPTGALDSETSKQIMEILKQISNERLIIMVTHNSELAEKYSNRIIKLNDGRVIDDSNPYNTQSNIESLSTSLDGKLSLEQANQNAEKVENKSNKNEASDIKDEKLLLTKSEKAELRQKNKEKKKALKKTSMNILTALKLSFTNLMTKKGRTFMTAFAGSIGIIGVALVLAISNGFSGYIKTMQTDMLANYPITIASQDIDANKLMNIMMGGAGGTSTSDKKFPNAPTIFPKDPTEAMKDMYIKNHLTKEYMAFVEAMREMEGVSSIRYSYNLDMNIIGEIDNSYASYNYSKKFTKVNNVPTMQENMGGIMGGGGMPSSVSINWQEMAGDKDFILSQFDVLAGEFPTNKNQLVLVVNDSNKVNQSILAAMNLPYTVDQEINFDKVISKNGESGVGFKLVMNDDYYKSIDEDGKKFEAKNDIKSLYQSENEKIENLDVVCVLRPKNNEKIKTLDMGIAYLNDLTKHVLDNAANSQIAVEQRKNENINVLTGQPMIGNDKQTVLEQLGVIDVPSVISIFPTDFNSKENLKKHLNEWNIDKEESDQITFTDMSQVMTEFMGKTVNIISIVLICFAAVSLVVSSIMIGIITYVSVVERTKEIGILRSLGARKFDISNVFNAETSIIGFISGLLGVVITYILSIPINLIVESKMKVASICLLNPWHALLLVVLSVGLTIIAGLIPSRIASKRDPVVALRTE